MASASHILIGLGAIVLGILSIIGITDSHVLTMIAVLGIAAVFSE